MSYYPERIICLTEETTEMLYLLGEQDRIVGISGYTVRPPQARKEKPKVSAFISAKIHEIIELKPDLVLGFSDIQADIARDLIKEGINVHFFNQRSVDEIYSMIAMLGAMVGKSGHANQWIEYNKKTISDISTQANKREGRRPIVYFEEWYDPIITGIKWVSELVELAGGQECFPHLSHEPLAKNRIIADPLTVAQANPDIIIGSWCGRRFRPETVYERLGWENVNAVKHKQIFEIKSANILQPGPAALTDGIEQLNDIIDNWHAQGLGMD